MTEDIVICNKSKICDLNEREYCPHAIPHKYDIECDLQCGNDDYCVVMYSLI